MQNAAAKISAVILLGLVAAACVAGEPESVVHDLVTTGATLTVEGGDAPFQRLQIAGTAGGHPLTIMVDLDHSAPATGLYGVDGDTWFESAAWANFNLGGRQSPQVLRVWAFGQCPACSAEEMGQLVTGAIMITEWAGDRISGTLDLTVEGQIPAFAGDPVVALSVRGTFAAQTTFVVPEQPVVDPPVVDELAVDEPQPETESAPPVNVQPQPDANPQPDVDGPHGVVVSDVRTVTLLAEHGVDFATGQVVAKANFGNSDIFATAGKSFLKLSTGGPNATAGRPLRWFTSASGFIRTFNNLGEVPLALPTLDNGARSLVHAKPYVGFVVQNNLSNLYARVWIEAGNEHSVTLNYQLVSAE
jgi:hypothetical protein